MNHSPTPWNNRDGDIEDSNGSAIATINSEADASLFMAAPGMLEALEAVYLALEYETDKELDLALVLARAAIASARGGAA